MPHDPDTYCNDAYWVVRLTALQGVGRGQAGREGQRGGVRPAESEQTRKFRGRRETRKGFARSLSDERPRSKGGEVERFEKPSGI